MKYIFLLFTTVLILTGCSRYTLLNSETYNNADMSDYENTASSAGPKASCLRACSL